MATPPIPHRDCRHFAPVDVARGICHRTKAPVAADAAVCDLFEAIPKCKRCIHFQPGASARDLGACGASPHTPKFPAYPDMVAVTCGDFEDRPPPAAGR
jgi:4-hydroxyphenylacetate decarboxylase small subunit